MPYLRKMSILKTWLRSRKVSGRENKRHGFSVEILFHFNCYRCGKWWSIGDCPKDVLTQTICPHCGAIGGTEEVKKLPAAD